MTNKNEVGYWINVNNNTKLADTKPELIVQAILEQMQQRIGFTFKHGTEAFPLSIACKADGSDESFTFHPDFIVSMPRNCTTGQLDKAIEVDGVYHFTAFQEKKRRWRDSLLLKQGFDVIHIDARVAYRKAHNGYLRTRLTQCLLHGSPVEMIAY